MIAFLIVTASLAVLGVRTSQCLGRWHPASLFVWGWVVTLAAVGLNPLGAEPVSPFVLLIILAGIGAFAAAAIIVGRRHAVMASPEAARPLPAGVRFTAVAALVLLLVVVGHLQYKAFVAGVLGVNDLASVDRGTIRRATTSGDAQHGGLGVLLLSLAPLLGCIGVEGYVRTRRAAWLLLSPLAIYLVSIDPGRSGVLSTITTSVVYLAYRERGRFAGRLRRAATRRAAAIVLLAAIFGLWFFVQQSLSVDAMPTEEKAPRYLPLALVEPVLYWTGGVNAFSVAFENGANPFERRGRTLSIAFRAAQIVDPDVIQPSGHAKFSNIPLATNVYTAFGDAWFDFGIAGVLVLMAALGAMTSAIHRRARSRGPKWAWLAAVLASSLVSTSLSFILFTVAVLFPSALGWILLRGTRTSSGTAMPPHLIGSTTAAM